jgi:hypothetical protein
MANFAKLDDQNVVVDVIAVANAVVNDLPFPESEALGVAFLTEWSGGYTNWKQTSYNANFRKNLAGIGYTYVPVLDAFVPPKPYPSWTLDALVCAWVPPSPYPSGENMYTWDEQSLQWVEVIQ